MAQQPAHRLGVLRIHPPQQHLGFGGVEHAEQVGGVIGIHGLENIGRALGVELPEQFGLVVLGEFLQHVGEPFVVECGDQLGAALGGQVPQCVGHLDRALSLELLQQLGDALIGHVQPGRSQTGHVLPVDHHHRRAPPQPAQAAHRDPGHHPVAGAGLLDAQIHHHDVDPGQLLLFGVIDTHPGVEDLAERQNLARPLGEPAQ